jgi:hypothetical protein
MVKPFSFGDDTPKQRRKKSTKQEQRWAGKAGGKAQAGSGAVWSSKGDVKQEDFLFENKRTDAESYRLSTDTWAEIDTKAMLAERRKPAMHIEIGKQKLRLVVLTEDDFLELMKLDK